MADRSTRVLSRRLQALLFGVALAPLVGARAALAAEGPAAVADASTVSEVVVTGSNIAGSVTSGAQPVTVISTQEMLNRGSPTILDLIKDLPASSGVLGDTNQFDARNGGPGSATVNLRGLGAERTLVLLNGRRLAPNPLVAGAAGAVDTNLIPFAAISRVEVLTDGAAAIYGSDAIAGVVNFITRAHQDGGEIALDYRYIANEDGDWTGSASWGKVWDKADLFISGGYQHRSQLEVRDRAFANPTYLQNPQGGYTAVGNPGSYAPLGPTLKAIGPVQRDVNCGALGGFAGFSGATPVCYARSTQFDNLVEREDRYQVFGAFNYALSDKATLHLEAFYAATVVPEYRTTPSQAISQFPTIEAAGSAALAGKLTVPVSNPGYASYLAANPGIFPADTAAVQLVDYRPFFLGGNPLYGDTGGSTDSQRHDAYRLSSGLTGKITEGLNYDINVAYSVDDTSSNSHDTLVDRLELALRGLGGPGCNPVTGAPGVGGCAYFNPFSTAVQRNPAQGLTNPQFNAAAANTNSDLIRWFYAPIHTEQKTSLLVVDTVVNGALPFRLWAPDPLKWALGGQFRRDSYDIAPSDINNLAINPCLASPDFGVTNCARKTGPFGLLAPVLPFSATRDVWALFGELHVPITERLELQVAGRYEDYGGTVGSTFNPKASAKLEVTDWFALRGSVQTTFRGPSLLNTVANPSTTLQQVLGIYTPVYVIGSPALKPETAFTYSVGGLVHAGGFRGSLDYWSFDFHNPITAEPLSAIVTALYPTNTTNNCANPAYADILARFTFNDTTNTGAKVANCIARSVSNVTTYAINGSPVKTSGLDIAANWDIDDVWGGRLTLGGAATYVLDYDVAPLSIAGVLAAPGFSAVGNLNYQTVAYPLPPWRGSVFAEYHRGRANLRWTINYIDGYADQRASIFAPSVNNSANGVAVALPQGQSIPSWVTHDVTFRTQLPHAVDLTVAVTNITDADPPFVRLNLSYDPFTANALGRTVKVGLRKTF